MDRFCYKVPFCGEVLRRLFYIICKDKQNLREAATVDGEMLTFWQNVRIPITDAKHRIPKLERLYYERIDLVKNTTKRKNRTGESERNGFQGKCFGDNCRCSF